MCLQSWTMICRKSSKASEVRPNPISFSLKDSLCLHPDPLFHTTTSSAPMLLNSTESMAWPFQLPDKVIVQNLPIDSAKILPSTLSPIQRTLRASNYTVGYGNTLSAIMIKEKIATTQTSSYLVWRKPCMPCYTCPSLLYSNPSFLRSRWNTKISLRAFRVWAAICDPSFWLP